MSAPAPARDFLFLPLPGMGARHLIERNVLVYRRIWMVIVSGAFEPLFYLLSLGFGLGAIVGDVTLPTGQVVSYAAFVAPAMMATAAMNGPSTRAPSTSSSSSTSIRPTTASCRRRWA